MLILPIIRCIIIKFQLTLLAACTRLQSAALALEVYHSKFKDSCTAVGFSSWKQKWYVLLSLVSVTSLNILIILGWVVCFLITKVRLIFPYDPRDKSSSGSGFRHRRQKSCAPPFFHFYAGGCVSITCPIAFCVKHHSNR